VVFANLINACANDNKKTMRDAAMGALKSGTELSELEGGGPNPLALEGVVGAFNSELKESDYKVRYCLVGYVDHGLSTVSLNDLRACLSSVYLSGGRTS
jgi:hypothetical protein